MNQPVNMEQRELMDLLIWIAQLGDKVQSVSAKVQKIQERTAINYRKIRDRELEALLLSAPLGLRLLDRNVFIYLPAIEKGTCFVPILGVEYDYSLHPPEIHLKVALFLISENDGLETLNAIGYRFETPHEGVRHRYCHIQHIIRFDQSERYKLPGAEWVPWEYPAFPVDAQDPIELLICMLVSLYDIDIIKKLDGKTKTIFETHIQRMKLHNLNL